MWMTKSFQLRNELPCTLSCQASIFYFISIMTMTGVKTLAGIFCWILIFVSFANSQELLNLRIQRTVPKSEVKNLIRADEDATENPGGGGGGGSAPINSTTKAECLDTVNNGGATCCMQYTWPGYTRNAHLVSSGAARNCSMVKAKDPFAVCFDPIVYTYNNYTTRPVPHLVDEFCEANNHDCFCAGSTCLTYVIYENGEGQRRVNESHFCGTLRLKNDDSSVTSGCYRETKNGFIYEVCACKDEPFCNDSPRISTTTMSKSILVLLLVITMSVKLLIR